MMDRSQLIRYANDSLLDEFQQRILIQTRYIETHIAMLQKELKSLQAEHDHLSTFFAKAEPKMPQVADAPQAPAFLQKQPKAAE